jgi:hypothetical protein
MWFELTGIYNVEIVKIIFARDLFIHGNQLLSLAQNFIKKYYFLLTLLYTVDDTFHQENVIYIIFATHFGMVGFKSFYFLIILMFH